MFELIKLPYAPDALEPVISAQTLSFHHGKHLQAYVDNLNKLIAGSEFESLCHSERSEESLLEEIVVRASLPAPTGNLKPIFNNAGQILNHNLYFTQFCPVIPSEVEGSPSVMPGPTSVMPGPTGHLKAQIEKQWGSLDAFKSEFEAKGVGLFGSGWVWLAAKKDGELVILQCPGADNPICHSERALCHSERSEESLRPLLTFDVWEHAYYLDYQNRRAAHLHALWDIVDWKVIEERF